MERDSIEPGILPLLRFFALARLVLVVLLAISWFVKKEASLPLTAWGDLVLTLGLFIFLFWKRALSLLGRMFLPLVIGLAIINTTLIQPGMLGSWTRDMYQPHAQFVALVHSYPTLVVLVVVVAWQYSLRRFWFFCFIIGLFEIIFYLQASPAERAALPLFATAFTLRLVSLPILGYVVAELVTRQRKQRRELEEAHQRLIHYTVTLEQLAVSRERNRLARELHDTLAHSLSAVAVQLEAVRSLWARDPEKAQSLLDSSLLATRNGLNEARRALQSLRASPLEDLGLVLALRRLAETCAERAGLQLHVQLPERDSELPPDIEQCIYRVAQEGLENVIRHAEARNLRLCFGVTDDLARLTIQDDGCGFQLDRAAKPQHFGLQGMRERSRLVGGEFEISTQPGQGTRLELTVRIGHATRTYL
jgi:signal transduction histidine kinase